METIKPHALQRGDTIGVVVPAGPVDRPRIDKALERLHVRGFRTKIYGDLYRASGYLSGDDATRASELIAAFEDPDTTAVWCARGGYGVVRILDHVEFEVIRRHPKVFIGFSDITALHLAIQQRAGLVTFHGPNLQDGFGAAEEMSPTTEAALWQAVLADEPSSRDAGQPWSPSGDQIDDVKAIAPGSATGRLTGGNLSVLCGLIGTPYEIDSSGRILFLEDVDEPPYRVDRYMAQLRLAGKLDAAAGILLGSFTDDCDRANHDSAIRDVLAEYCVNLSVPVLAGWPSGHRRENWTLPMGALMEIDTTRKQARVREDPCRS